LTVHPVGMQVKTIVYYSLIITTS